MSDFDFFTHLEREFNSIDLLTRYGVVMEVKANTIYASVPNAAIGVLCLIYKTKDLNEYILGEVVAFKGDVAVVSCLEPVVGISCGALVSSLNNAHEVNVNSKLLGTILDGFGRPMGQSSSGGAMCLHTRGTPVIKEAPLASERPPIVEPMSTGVSVLDSIALMGQGQRIGIFAGPGCGKSTLLAQIARGVHADVIVVGLVGERGRELREFIEHEFDEQLRAKAVFVCATSDKSSIERVRAAFTATAIAEKFRDEGKQVVLMIDSLTRLARAQREIGLLAGEPATKNGFTPSVYALLPTLIERAGRTSSGDITGIYTILLESDHITDDPIASEAKSLLDGHIVLRQELVQRGQFPAVDVLGSLSRVMNNVADEHHKKIAQTIREIYSRYQDVELLVKINEYQQGQNHKNDFAIEFKEKIDQLFKQNNKTSIDLMSTLETLEDIYTRFNVLD